SRLRFCRDGADLDESEAERGPRRNRNAVLVESRGEPDGIAEREPEKRRWFRRRPETLELAKRGRPIGRRAQIADSEVVRRFRRKRKEQRPNDTFVEACRVHLPMQNWAKSASRISSALAAPVISSRARKAARRSTATYSGASAHSIVPAAKSHEARARRRQSRWRALIATPLSGRKCFSEIFAMIASSKPRNPSAERQQMRSASTFCQSACSARSLLFRRMRRIC